LNFEPEKRERRKKMVNRYDYVDPNTHSDDAKISSKAVNKMDLEEVHADIKEVNHHREALEKKIVNLHRKESLLVMRKRAIQLEERLINEAG